MTSDSKAPTRRRRAPIWRALLLSASAAFVFTVLDGYA